MISQSNLPEHFRVWDIHVHNWSSLSEPTAFAGWLERTKVDHVTLLGPLLGGLQPAVGDIEASNNRTHAYMREFGERIAGLCYLNPSHPDHAKEEWRRCAALGFSGVKLWVATWCDVPAVDLIVDEVAAAGKFLLAHTWRKAGGNLPGESEPGHLATLAKRHPQATFVMAHIGGDWEHGIKVVADLPNITVDYSGTIHERGAYEMALRELGEDRIVFGSDAPADYLTCLGRVLQLDVPDKTRRKILYGNAARLHDCSLTPSMKSIDQE